MTLIAGIVSRKPNTPPPVSICETLRQKISRLEGQKIDVFADERSFLVKLDIGAFGESAVHRGSGGSITLVTGDPLLGRETGSDTGREADTAAIDLDMESGTYRNLTAANGAFSAVNYRPERNEIRLVADKLGLRPLYYWIGPEFVIFASAMRILEKVDAIPKRLDVRAVTELVGLGYPLADLTPYTDIRLLKAAEILSVAGETVSSETYWNWDLIEEADRPEDEVLTELYSSFMVAVERRNRNDSVTAAYLSGGLDSRCIVAALVEQKASVHTYNFSRSKTQDQVFGREFARAAGTTHYEIPKQAVDLVPDYSVLMADAWLTEQAAGTIAEHPNIVWSGEGGSVALGHVHLTENMVEMLRSGQTDAAIEEHLALEFAQVSPKLFRKEIAERISSIIHDGIREELAKFDCNDNARGFYLHLLVNDQHRKLAKHFENIDLHRLEFHLPFFDSSFVALILTVPLDRCLLHRLYVKLLDRFPQAVRSVPWQAYPGHVPCPVPVPEGLAYQWEDKYQSSERAARKRVVMEQAAKMLDSETFPDEILNKRTLRLAKWAHATGLRDYGYIIGPASTFFEYWKMCGGDHLLP